MPGQVERKFACACSFAIKLSTKESMGVLFNSWIKKATELHSYPEL